MSTKPSMFRLMQLMGVLLATLLKGAAPQQQQQQQQQQPATRGRKSKQRRSKGDDSISTHTDNWAVLVSTSKFWFNYRHNGNVLSLYHILKSQGVPDSQIIVMLADDMACNPRNPIPATIFNNRKHEINLYGDDVEVDFRGPDVSIDSFLRILTGRQDDNTPASKRLNTNENSNIIVYMSGHGGEDFLKFQDFDHISGSDISSAFQQMYDQRRFNEILFFADTCHAGSLLEGIRTPGVFGFGSSHRLENAYSRDFDHDLGISVIDEFTSAMLRFFSKDDKRRAQADAAGTTPPLSTIHDLALFMNSPEADIRSTVVYNADFYPRDPRKVPLRDFFAAHTNTSATSDSTVFTLEALDPIELLPPDTFATNCTAKKPTFSATLHDFLSQAAHAMQMPIDRAMLALCGLLVVSGTMLTLV